MNILVLQASKTRKTTDQILLSSFTPYLLATIIIIIQEDGEFFDLVKNRYGNTEFNIPIDYFGEMIENCMKYEQIIEEVGNEEYRSTDYGQPANRFES